MKSPTIALLQIILLMGMTFSNMYFIESSDNIQAIESNSLLNKIIKFFNLLPSVSALDADDLAQGTSTCLKTKTGSFCQEMLTTDCATKCDGACVPASVSNVPQCKPGTCYSSKQGTCQIGASQIACESAGGSWNADPNGNIPQCKRGCCILGSQTAFVGSSECTVLSAQLGVTKTFKSEITTEIACVALSGADTQGACVIEADGENTCKFTSKSSCLKINGEFHANYLCSAPELETNCVRQETAKCVDGKDEMYWFDSCGNQENIYSANKEQSWNGGKVLSKSSSCSLDGNKATCGNCNYLLGTKCGPKTNTQKVADNTINSVCRDLSCVDDNGKARKNGESWCAFDSRIGVDQGRSTDVAGSRQFRKICIDGEVRTEPCQDFRNGVCVESQNNEIEGGFSSAACKINGWQTCINYNFENQTDKCVGNSDCFLNEVKISDSYNFQMCAPKYNPGFDMTAKPEAAEAICSLASQKCTVVFVKGFLSGYKCKQNCECLQKEFGEKLSNLCVSLGDCGPKVNIAGKQTGNYQISNSPALSASYLAGLASYKNPVAGQHADIGNTSLLDGSLGIPSFIDGQPIDTHDAVLNLASNIGGGVGMGLVAASWIAAHIAGGVAVETIAGSSFLSFLAGATPSVGVGSTAVAATAPAGGVASINAAFTQGAVTSAAAWGGAIAGAAIGLSLTSLLLKLSGVGGGLPSGMVYGLLALGTYSGAVIGYTLVTQGSAGLGFTTSASVGIWAAAAVWAAVIVVAVIVIMKILGVGKTRTTIVEFKCQPWQAPTGGADCSKCGTNGLPCSKYSCQSLGQTCQLVNEGTDSESCVDVSPNDVSAPVITPLQGALLNGFAYSSVSDQGYTVQSSQGCVPAFTNVQFGLSINEAAQCKFDVVHTSNYKDMEFSFGGRNLYLTNHTMSLNIPSLESLGVTDVNATSNADYNLYVRCQDKNGNSNIREYAINFCVSQGLDVTPPIVIRGSPLSDTLAYNAQTANVTVYTNEPATCKISTSDMLYDNMQTEMNCSQDAGDQGAFGYGCNSIPALSGNSTTFYIRCADQPWLNATDIANGKKRNVNGQSLIISLKKSLTQLKIDSLEPNNKTIYSNTYPATVELLARTSGGVSGNAICSLNISGNLVQFLNTGLRDHSWSLNQMTAGNKTAQVICVDDAGNTASRTSTFSVVVDTDVPTVTRVYGQSNTLYVVTDEQSECAYSTKECEFDYDSANIMSGIDKIHTTSFDENKDYYITCKDRFGNKAGQCTIVLRKGELENA